MYGFCAGLYSASDAEATSKDVLSYNGRVSCSLMPANVLANICTLRKISRYSPSEAAKVYEKAMQRHPVSAFDPKPILAVLLEESIVGHELIDNEKKELIERYLDVSF